MEKVRKSSFLWNDVAFDTFKTKIDSAKSNESLKILQTDKDVILFEIC